MSFATTRLSAPLRHLALACALGSLLSPGMALADSQPLALDPGAAALRLTGRFRVNDRAGFLAALPVVLPVAVTAGADGGLRISTR